MVNNIESNYINWLLNKVNAYGDHSYLLTYLYDTPFIALLPMDENRVADGIDLRYAFGYEHNIDYRVIASELDVKDCSILEMMVSLAMKMEVDYMTDEFHRDRTAIWFRNMLLSLDVYKFTDDVFDPNKVETKIKRFIERRYNPDGSGGLFTIPNCEYDLTAVEIWFQMCWYSNYLLERAK